MNTNPKCLFIFLAMVIPSMALASLDHLRQSVVKIHVTVQRDDFQQPWQAGSAGGGNGSGYILPGKRILTNAHVVSDTRFIEVQREGDTRRYPAKVAFAAHDCDLAILEVIDPRFFENSRPLALGTSLPGLNDEVLVLGYPMGGDRLSLTKGVVSRIDYGLYTHSTVDSHLVLQVDAAINPGNSGGPVLFKSKVIGLAFQGIMGSQSIGYSIPLPVIQHFLDDVRDGTYDGYPELGVQDLELTNPAMRKDLRLTDRQTGVVVTYVDPFGAANGLLLDRDVLTAIDGVSIANDGSTSYDGNTVEYTELVERKQCGDKVVFSIIRNGEPRQIAVPLKKITDQFIFRQTYDLKPEYWIVGGLAFSPLSRGYLLTLGSEINTPSAQQLLYYSEFAKMDELYKGRNSFIVLITRLPHPVNTYCDGFINQIIHSINGKTIRSMPDIPVALATPSNGFHVITFEGHDNPLILDAAAAELADKEILNRYNIPSGGYVRMENRP
jgi:S1-C subfamily serine protease